MKKEKNVHFTKIKRINILSTVKSDLEGLNITWKSKGEVPNCVNIAVQTAATHLLVVRHKDEVGVLAGVLNALRVDEINVESMKNIVFSGSLAACAHIQVSQAPSTQLVDQILDNPSIFAVDVVDLESQ